MEMPAGEERSVIMQNVPSFLGTAPIGEVRKLSRGIC